MVGVVQERRRSRKHISVRDTNDVYSCMVCIRDVGRGCRKGAEHEKTPMSFCSVMLLLWYTLVSVDVDDSQENVPF